MERSEVLRDSRINFICHVYVSNRQKLEETYNNTIKEGNNDNVESTLEAFSPTVRITQITDCESCNFVPDGCVWVGTEDGK